MSPRPLVTEQLAWGYAASATLGTGLSLEVESGEAVAVVGPNGAGKSTLLKTLAGQLAPLSGSVLLGGADALPMRLRDRAQRVAVLPQSAPLDLDLTVLELVELGRTPHLGIWGAMTAEDRVAVERAIEQCGLTDLARSRLGKVSGGERQRAHVAMAVAQEAALLLLDEPTAHLDLRRRFELFELLARLREHSSLAVVMVLQDLSEAVRQSTRVLLTHAHHVEVVPSSDPALHTRFAEVFGVPVERIVL